MKKYLFSLFAVVAVVGCTTFKDEEPLKPVIPSNPNIQISEVGDNEFTFTITPAEGTGFFSYAVLAGEKQDLNPTTLLKVGYKNGVKAGTVDFKKTKAAFVGKAEDLAFASTYTVYAVAASEQGNVGEVVSSTITTSDNVKPAIAGYSRKGNVLTVTFSENVTLSAKRMAYAKYYAINEVVIGADGTLAKDGEQGDGVVAVACSGKTATFTVTLDGTAPLPAGAYYTVSFSTGLFQDQSGNNIEGVESYMGVTKSGSIGFAGLYGHIDNKPFSIVPASDLVTPADTYILLGFPEGVKFADFTSTAAAAMTVVSVDGSKTTSTEYALSLDEEWSYSVTDKAILILFPDGIEIASGDNINVSVAEGSMEDIYGNTNTAMTQDYLYSYGYTIDDIAGVYKNSGKSGYGSDYDESAWKLAIEASDDPSKGNVMVTTYYNLPAKIYADFDFDTGIFTMPFYYEPISGVVSDGVYYDFYTLGYYSGIKDQKNDLIMEMTESGVFTAANDYLGYYFEAYAMPESGNVEDIDPDNDYLGYDYNIFIPTPLSKVGSISAPKNAPAKEVEMPVVEKTVFKRERK